MGNRGVDLAQLKAARAARAAFEDQQRLLGWARAMQAWLTSPLPDDGPDRRRIKIGISGEELVVERRRYDPDIDI